MNITDRATFTLISGSLDRLGCAMPKAVTDAQELVRTTQRGLRLPSSESLGDVILDALAAGRPVEEDPEVIRLAVSRSLGEMFGPSYFQDRALSRLLEAYRANADVIVESLSEPFDDAAADLTAAVPVLGDRDLDDHAGILTKGGDVARHFIAVVEAQKTVDAVTNAWKQLAQLAGIQVNPHQAVIVADIPHAELVEHSLTGNPRPWDIVRTGYTLALPATFAEYYERSVAANAGPTPTEADRWRQEQAHGAAQVQKALDANRAAEAARTPA